MNRPTKGALLAVLIAVVIAAPGCGFINQLRAKDSLNQGVREFNKGKYDIAQEKFERALELAPELANAQLFYARAVNARFEQAQTEDLGLKAIAAYDNIIAHNRDDAEALDRALAFQAKTYEDLARVNPEKADEYKAKQVETLLKRSELPSATDQTKADVYYTLGVGYWEEAYNRSRQFTYADGSLRQPIPPETADWMRPRLQKAHEFLNRAVATKPDYANAYFYESLVYRQDALLETNPENKKQIDEKIKALLEKYRSLQGQQQTQASEGSAAK